MNILKRKGCEELFSENKMLYFLNSTKKVTPQLNHIDTNRLTKKIKSGIPRQMTSDEMLIYAAEIASSMSTESYDYALLGGRIEMIRIYSNTPKTFKEAMLKLKDVMDSEFMNKIMRYDYSPHINGLSDFTYDIIGVRTLLRSYLLRDKMGNTVERPQYMLMRVAVFLNDTIEKTLETYEALCQKYYTHASPTLFHAGMKQHQLASCFLMQMQDDSIEGIFDTLKATALISKSAGGIGLSVSNIRAKGTPIAGTNGISNGLVPCLKVFNHTARYVDQGGGKRKGSFAIYIEPWHLDIESILQLKLNTGNEEDRARDLFYALWMPDYFMRAVEEDADWYLFCPTDAPQLQETWGNTFDAYYTKAIESGKARKKMKARDLWNQIIRTQIETGTPYILYKDACNAKSNQQNLGVIKSSNLCAEIVEYTSKDEISVCTLASICLNMFVSKNGFNFDKLEKTAELVCCNLNKTIDKTSYPVEETRNSNLKHRPIGIGIQGLHDVYQMMGLAYDSDEANNLSALISETIYYGAMKESIRLAKKDGPYSSFCESPLSHGKFQFDLWGIPPVKDWEPLRRDVMQHGARNSLLVACMPTASTAQIMGNTESFEPRTSNMYVRRVLSGEFIVINKYLESICRKSGEWTEQLVAQIIKDRGSVQNTSLSSNIKRIYKTVWEISQKHVIQQSASRAPFVDQSQSMNLYLESPNMANVSSMQFFAWKSGLKTGQYYLRSRPKANAVQFTVECNSCSS
jgi:ribonucleoside-diphosphate reductase alpha chain